MREGGLLLVAFGASYTGFALLALSQDRHWHRLTGERDCPRGLSLALRSSGYALLAVSLVLTLVRDGPGFGALLWVALLSLGAIAVVCTLTWSARWFRPITRLLQSLYRVPEGRS